MRTGKYSFTKKALILSDVTVMFCHQIRMCHYSGILSTVFNRYFLNFKAHLFLARILKHYLEQTFCIILCDTSTSVIDGVEYTQSFSLFMLFSLAKNQLGFCYLSFCLSFCLCCVITFESSIWLERKTHMQSPAVCHKFITSRGSCIIHVGCPTPMINVE